MRRLILVLAVSLACIIPGMAPRAFSQATSGSILGKVIDPSGAVVPGAEVTATNQGTAISQKTQTNAAGDFLITHLTPATYKLSVTATGFKSLSRDVDLHLDQQINVDLMLTVGATSDSVTVTAATPTLQTQSSDTGQVIQTKEILDLPLLGRNVLDLTRLTTGVTSGSGGNSDNLAVNGQREFANSIVLGGVEVTGNRNNDASVTPSVDAVQEFKVVTSAYAPEFGRASGGVVLLETKSGTNQYHGSIYDFYRPDTTAAVDYFSQSQSQLNQNNFGATIGGPIRKDKTFFFASYEGLLNHDGSSFLTSVPPSNQIVYNPDGSVDLSGLLDPYTGATIPIFDPEVTASNFGYPVQQFPGNIIPADRVSQAGVAVLQNFFPHPTRPGQQNGWYLNALDNYKTSFTSNTVDARIDHYISSKDHLSGEYHFGQFHSRVGDPYAGQIPVPGGGGDDVGDDSTTQNQVFSLNETHTFNPQMINQFLFGFNNFSLQQLSLMNGRNVADEFGVENVNLPGWPQSEGFPTIYMAGFGEYMGGSTYKPLTFLDRNYQFVDMISLTHGTHQFKFGGEYRNVSSRPGFSLFPTGYQYYSGGNFTISETSDPFIVQDYSAFYTNGGSDIADMILGLPTYVNLGLQLTDPETKTWEIHGFFQDSWRATPTLTLFYGLRYEFQNPYTEVNNESTNFDLNTGQILLAGRGGNSTALINADKNNWGPRVGFAYQFQAKTVIRGGYGIYYSPENDAREDILTKNYPFNNQQAFDNSYYNGFPFQYVLDTGVTRNTTINIPDGASSIDPSTIPNSTSQQVYYVNPDIRTGYSQLYNMTVQRELAPDLSLEVGFVGSQGRKLSYAVGNINQTNPPNQPLPIPYPFLGQIQGLYSVGSSTYNSLQAKLTKNYSNHLSFLVAYTYGQSIDNGPAPFNLGRNHQQPQNPFDLPLERAVSANDIRNNLVASFIYELPFGRNQMFLSNLNKWEESILGGWQINGIVGLHSGLPFNVIQNGNVQNAPGLRPNQIGNPNLADPQVGLNALWFNPKAFCVANCDPPLDGPGDVSRNSLRGPGYFNLDFSLFKTIPLSERFQLQLRFEAFNVTNTPQFGNPDSDFHDANFGKVSGTVGNPRVLQFAAKINF